MHAAYALQKYLTEFMPYVLQYSLTIAACLCYNSGSVHAFTWGTYIVLVVLVRQLRMKTVGDVQKQIICE
jgi:hypothetical protein